MDHQLICCLFVLFQVFGRQVLIAEMIGGVENKKEQESATMRVSSSKSRKIIAKYITKDYYAKYRKFLTRKAHKVKTRMDKK